MMRETKKSLKAYFIVVGVLGVLFGVGPIIVVPDILFKIFSIITLVIAIMFFYYGIKLYDYLQRSPKTLVNFVIISLSVYAILRLIVGQWIYVIGSILLGWYLIHNIKKLSGQSDIVDNKK